MKKILISLFFIVFASSSSANDDFGDPISVQEAKNIITTGLKHIGYCETYKELLVNHPNAKYNQFKPFVNQIRINNILKYSICENIGSIVNSALFKGWQSENLDLYYYSYSVGICELHEDIMEMDQYDKEIERFQAETTKSFSQTLYKLRETAIDTETDLFKKYNIDRSIEVDRQCKFYKDSFDKVDLNIDEVAHRVITDKLIFKKPQ